MQTDDVLILLQDVAEEIIKPRFRTLAAEEIAEKNPGDLVTVADREAEVRITEALLRAYPDALVLGEEASADDPGLMASFQAADHAFTVDPVDGTKNFVHGSPDHAVMVAGPRWETWCGAGSGSRSTRSPTWRSAGPAPGRTAGGCSPPLGDDLRGVTSRRTWVGRAVGSTAGARPHVGLLRGGLPEARRGRGRLRALPASEALGPRTGFAAAHRAGGFVGTFDGSPTAPVSTLSGSSPQPIARPTTSCTTSSTRFPVSDLFAAPGPAVVRT